MKVIIITFALLILLCGTSIAQSKLNVLTKQIKITVSILDEKQPDSVCLFFYDGSSELNYPNKKYALSKKDDGKYAFVIEETYRPAYFSIFTERGLTGYPDFLMNHFLCEPGDNVTIHMKNNIDVSKPTHQINYYLYRPYDHLVKNGKNLRYEPQFEFSGMGAAKYACRYEGDLKSLTFLNFYGFPVDKQGQFINNDHCDSAKQAVFEIIEKYKAQLSVPAYQILQADAEANYEIERIEWFKNITFGTLSKFDTSYFGNTYRSYIAKVKASNLKVSNEAKTRSFNFAKYGGYFYFYFEGGLFSNKGNLADAYASIKANYSGELRDKILTNFLKRSYGKLSQNDNDMAIVRDALTIIQTPYCLYELNQYIASHSKGVKAYDFNLPDTNGKMVKLSDYLGRVVFIDFWYTGCGNCGIYYKKVVSPVEQIFEHNKDVIFVTISVDTEKEKWLNSIKTGVYTSQNIINLYTEGKGYEHPVSKFYQVQGAPRPILVGRNGFVYSNNNSDLRSNGIQGLQKTIEAALAEK